MASMLQLTSVPLMSHVVFTILRSIVVADPDVKSTIEI